MTLTPHDQLATLCEQREELEAERLRIDRAYCLAVLDHVTARIRAACPKAVYVSFAFHGSRRTLDLHGVLGAQPSPLGTCPELWSNYGEPEEHPLDDIADQIEFDVEAALAPHSSPAWAFVRRNTASDGNSWLLELPPADRVERVAQLVREHHPEATAVVVDGRVAGGRIIEIIEGVTADGTEIRTARRRWTAECNDTLTHLVAQIFDLPALAHRHLEPLDGPYPHPYGTRTSDQVRLLRLPPRP
ncbi:hypothetical protein ACH41E_30260 [Streptomyces sp. NPDC020412]|uniref:hypothetical protein n=1 Tax=Streptomyces sp. NPDC020412 TaxID=3365073 RepID=UPI0037B66DBF